MISTNLLFYDFSSTCMRDVNQPNKLSSVEPVDLHVRCESTKILFLGNRSSDQ